MSLGTDGMQQHVKSSATPADLFKRRTAGSLRNWSDRLTMKIMPEWGCVMECKCCKPTSALQTSGRCSVTTACGKHWEQQGFAQSPGSMPGRRRTRWGGWLCREASGQEGAYQVFLTGPHTAQAVAPSHGHSYHQVWLIHTVYVLYEVPLIKLECPALEWAHASSHAASSSSNSASTSNSTSRRSWRADSRREQSALGSNQLL